MKRKSNIKSGWADRLFTVITRILLFLFLLLVTYPVFFVVIASFTDPVYVNSGQMLLYPKGFTTIGYSQVFRDMRIWQSYVNTILYAACGTFSVWLSVSRPDMPSPPPACPVKCTDGSSGIYHVFRRRPDSYLSGGQRTSSDKYTAPADHHGKRIRIQYYPDTFLFSNMLPRELQDAAFIDGCGNAGYFSGSPCRCQKRLYRLLRSTWL